MSEDMIRVPGGTFAMGSEDFYPEERPVRQVAVDGFWMDDHPVTVAEFRWFVAATGYATVAERPLDPADYPDADPSLLHPGSLVFHQPPGPVDLGDPAQWWRYTPGASWRQPRGPGSTLDGRAKNCPPRRNGSSPPAAACPGPSSPGVTRPRRAGG
jgi:formylglycine-generating enzyme required for sulfatase activity